jgi:hypothetical protein
MICRKVIQAAPTQGGDNPDHTTPAERIWRAEIRHKVQAVRAVAIAAGTWPSSRRGPLPQPIAATLDTDPPGSWCLQWVVGRGRRFLTPAEVEQWGLQQITEYTPPPLEVRSPSQLQVRAARANKTEDSIQPKAARRRGDE